uniref:T9SS C-terminal target domain-containing protein n=1 Tax=Chryseobacterium endophyticum TaxID=1854762 RepID=A0AAU6WMR1_9FLAO
MKKTLLIIALAISTLSFSQQSTLLKIRKYRVGYLDNRIKESLGLSLINGKLYTFNDSGNTPELFELDKKTGNIISTIKINGKNKDWEALTNDGQNFYIGDFGNNGGTRKDLEIYKVPVKNDSIQLISFEYPEQQEFTPKYSQTDFDAEAMVYLEGKIHLFTKEWGTKATSHYIIDPEIPGKQQAEKTETYKTGFMVTDASYFNKKLYLIGYTKKTEVFLNIFTESSPGVFFNENPEKYYLGSALAIGQIEGIAVDNSGIYISGEKFNSPVGGGKQSLYFIPKDKLGN